MLPKSVENHLREHRDEYIERLFEFLRFASIANVKSQPDQCELCAEWLAEYLTTLGLETRIAPTANKPNVIASMCVDDKAPTLLIYGHYDVQPPEPLEQWLSDPFEPVIRDGSIYARGVADDKGMLFAHLIAIDAWIKAGGGLPVNVKVFIEGEEEIGSPGLEPFITADADALAADAAVISDSEFFAEDIPSITYALRGLASVELTLKGAGSDVHSGVHGGALANPINALARMIAALHDADGRVTIPGFYDDVLPLSRAERESWSELPMDEKTYAAELGVGELAGGERSYTVLERLWARPTLDCNGIVGGYTAEGTKTIIPAQASVKISMRLVNDQDPEKIATGFRRFVAENTPKGMVASVQVNAEARPVILKTDTPAMQAADEAYLEAFGRRPAMIRSGASVPVVELIQRLLGIEAVLMGFGLPGDNIHAPNERFRLEQLWRGACTSAGFLQNLSRQWKRR